MPISPSDSQDSVPEGPHNRDAPVWTADGVPVSRRFDDPYYSLAGGLAETRHVFLTGNDLPARLAPGFRIAELGFGTGLNLIATVIAWRASGIQGRLSYTSFEAFPLAAPDMARAHAAFPETGSVSAEIMPFWAQGVTEFTLGTVDVRVVTGDAQQTLPGWGGQADAWYLDGFSPAKNPDLWSPAILSDMATHTAPGGTFATYTAAGHVRRGLQAAGFQVCRVPGFGRKRHMTRGTLRPAPV
jgi:tRNA U34 5-methylaminomethyl-2-thiouridine-forming methyltransferase MnmC